MADCNEIVKEIYLNNDLNALISKIKPESIRDDLKQEIALSLLNAPCEKISSLYVKNNLLAYVMRVCWLMATSKTSEFYRKHRRSDFAQAVEYIRLMQPSNQISNSVVFIAQKAICDKAQKTVYDDHEARLFNKYVELGSSRAVARFYNIPAMHVCRVVSKVKQELKQIACG